MDVDCWVRLVPFVYGAPASMSLWSNDGKGNFYQSDGRLGSSIPGNWNDNEGNHRLGGDGNWILIFVGDWTAPIFLPKIQVIKQSEKIEMPETSNSKVVPDHPLEIAD